MIPIPSPLVEFMLLGPLEDRRLLQDSPILGDVWVRFGNDPEAPADLLISPYRDQHAGDVAKKLLDAIVPNLDKVDKDLVHDPQIAFLQGLVVANLTFEQVIQFILPNTKWWAQRWRANDDEEQVTPPGTPPGDKKKRGTHELKAYTREKIQEVVGTIFEAVKEWQKPGSTTAPDMTETQELSALDRFVALTGLLLWARHHVREEEKEVSEGPAPGPQPAIEVTPEPAPESGTEPQPPDTAATPSESSEEPTADGGGAPLPERSAEPPSEGDAPPPPENVADATPPPAAPSAPAQSATKTVPPTRKVKPQLSVQEQIAYIQDHAKPAEIADELEKLKEKMLVDPEGGDLKEPTVLIWQVSLNRQPMPALTRSIPAVKADAAHTVFRVNCGTIAWAVIDSGIDGNHPAFSGRVKASYDFKNYRKIVNVSNTNKYLREKTLADLKKDPMWKALKNPFPPDDDKPALEALERLAKDAAAKGPINWELVERFVEINPGTKPRSNHGTHVAGIIGASKQAALDHVRSEAEKSQLNEQDRVKAQANVERMVKALCQTTADFADGMCPDIQLYDFRVLGKDIKDWEFAIIASLQFIRYLNDRHNFITVHGANLSLSIPHDVRNFACGRTPICNECERLVESGVVVVAAAGNHGYKSFETKDGSYESYAAFSITDPGNADGVITVGATHRFWPHTYGISFFSSRGPTGDGRLKPDLVAPGEKIRAPVPAPNSGKVKPGGDWGDLDGTSMAAPHVSGAAAMLMARYSEFIGQPRRIKRILCETATDLGRERSFQGHGMLDVLRAFQSI